MLGLQDGMKLISYNCFKLVTKCVIL